MKWQAENDEASEYCYYHDSRSKATVEDESDSISEKVDEAYYEYREEW